MRGGATASIDQTLLTAGAVSVTAAAEAIITASLETAAEAQGGSSFLRNSLAASGVIATNTVRGGAEAFITDSTLTATGDVSVEAQNTREITAHLVNAISSGQAAIGVTLAFNTVGWAPQNILFNTVDALLGDTTVANAFDNEEGAGAKAYLLDSTVHAAGILTVSAINAGSIASDVANSSESDAEAWLGAVGTSFGGVIASNKVSADAEASIDWSDAYVLGGADRRIVAGDGIIVRADNAADLSASIELEVSSETVNNALDGNNIAASDAIGISGAVSYNDVRSGATAYIDRAQELDTAGDLTVEAAQQLHLRRPGQQQRPLLRRQHLRRRRLHRHLAGGMPPTPCRVTAKPTSATARSARPTIRSPANPIGGDVNVHARQRHRPDRRNQQPHHLGRPVGQRHPGVQQPRLGTAKPPVQPG